MSPIKIRGGARGVQFYINPTPCSFPCCPCPKPVADLIQGHFLFPSDLELVTGLSETLAWGLLFCQLLWIKKGLVVSPRESVIELARLSRAGYVAPV